MKKERIDKELETLSPGDCPIPVLLKIREKKD